MIGRGFSDILHGLCGVEFLSLGDFREEMDPSILNLPVFDNLVELQLWNFFLQSVLSLKFLKLISWMIRMVNLKIVLYTVI